MYENETLEVEATEKSASEAMQAARIAAERAENHANADKLYIGAREITVERAATTDDVGYYDDQACSVVVFVDAGVEFVVLDALIQTRPQL